MDNEGTCRSCGWAIWSGRDGISPLGESGACSFEPMPSWYFLKGVGNSDDYHFHWNHCFTGCLTWKPKETSDA